MSEVNLELREAMFADAQHALDSRNHPAASIQFVDYADSKVVLVRFNFAITQQDGPIRGSLFRFFLSGLVQNLNWERDEEFSIIGRDHGFHFVYPAFNPEEVVNDDELDYFVDSVHQFVIECLRNSGATLDDRVHV